MNIIVCKKKIKKPKRKKEEQKKDKESKTIILKVERNIIIDFP